MTKTYKWETPNGNKIEMTIVVEHITEDIAYADGWNIPICCDYWKRDIVTMKVNGKNTELKELYLEGNIDCVLIDRMGKDRLLVAIPPEIVNEVYGEERKTEHENLKKELLAAKEFEKHQERIYKMMDAEPENELGPIQKNICVNKE